MMDEGQSSSSSLPPFIGKIYEMVDDPSSDSIVSWSRNNKSFVVWNPPEFARMLLPRFFKHNNFSSFIRQLNTYGFRKIDPEQWEFANEDFVRGRPHLLKNIHRRKPVHSHSMQNLQGQSASSSPLTDSERQGYKDDIERLKCEKESLHLEFQRYKQENQLPELQQIRGLTERLQHLERRQKDMVSTLARSFQNPMLALSLTPQSEQIQDRKRRLPRKGYFHDHGSSEDNQISVSQGLISESSDATNSSLVFDDNLHFLEQMESSISFWESIVLEVALAYVQEKPSLDLDESTSCADSPPVCYPQLNLDVGCKSPGIDMNSEPAAAAAALVPEVAASREQVATSVIRVATGVNDVFWEQFLTENPGSADASEVQSGRKDLENRKNEDKPVDSGKFWWTMRSVNKLTEQLGELSPAEKT